jgi:hypothetical protein
MTGWLEFGILQNTTCFPTYLDPPHKFPCIYLLKCDIVQMILVLIHSNQSTNLTVIPNAIDGWMHEKEEEMFQKDAQCQ